MAILMPNPNRVIVFVDGQNLYMRICECFPDLPHRGHCDLGPLANGLVNLAPDRALTEIRYYTGIQDSQTDPNGYAGKQRYLAKLTKAGITVKQRPMKYSREWVKDRVQPATGGPRFVQIWQAREKGIDIMLALDLVLMADANAYDTAIIVSQDTDLDVAVEAAFHIVGQRHYLAIENAYIPAGAPGTLFNNARLANTVPRALSRVFLQKIGAIP